MDHAINSVNTFYEISLDYLYDEWVTGEYKKISDCPSFEEASTYRKAINVMKKYCYGQVSRGSVMEDLKGYIWMTKSFQISIKKCKSV